MRATIKKQCGYFLALVLRPCSKSKEGCNPNNEESPCYITLKPDEELLLKEEKPNGITEMRFEYNNKNQIVTRYIHGTDGSIVTKNFTYDGNSLSRIERKSNGQFVMSEEYIYENGNKPTTINLRNNKN